MIYAAAIISAFAWFVASAIRNAHICTCNEPGCGGGCEPAPRSDAVIFDYAATDDKI